MTLNGKINRSVKLIRECAEKSAPLLVNFSGGKDSLVCLILALDVAEDVEAFYIDSGMDLPFTKPYIKARCREFGVHLNISHPSRDRIQHKPGGPMPSNACLLQDYVRHWGYFPTEVKRYCATWLKHRPARVYCRKKWGFRSLFKVVGVRTSESPTRKWKYGSAWARRVYGGTKYVRPDNEHSGSFMVFPILDWTLRDVESFLEARNVEIHRGYKLFGMSGCKWCPVAKLNQIRAIHRKFLGIYDDLIAAEKDVGKPAFQHRRVWLRDLCV